MWLFSVWLKAIQPFCLALVIQFPHKQISCQGSACFLFPALSKSWISGEHAQKMSVLLSHPSYDINQGQGTFEIGTLQICNRRDPPSEVHRTKIVNGPSSTDMTSLRSPFLLHFLPLAFQAVAIWGNTLLFSAFSI